MIEALEKIKEILGNNNYIDNHSDMSSYIEAWRGSFIGKSPLICFPNTTNKVSDIIKICNNNNIPIIPQGGNTGLVGGSTPDNSGREIVINLSRMNNIIEIDTINSTVTVESGCILSLLKEKLEDYNLLFPLSMASEASAEIGGIISTNAGGTAVLRYGNVRQLVLGLEIVTPNGDIIDNLSGLRKNNVGYDINQLFVGAEGTLGIVTKATFKLFPKPIKYETAFLALNKLEDSLALLNIFREIAEDSLTAFEIVPNIGIELVKKHTSIKESPLVSEAEWKLLVELSTANKNKDIRKDIEQALIPAFEQELILDGVISENVTQSKHIWSIRENITEAEKKEGAMINFDISVPISSIADFINDAIEECSNKIPDIRAIPFGHIGDGNIHFNLIQPINMEADKFLSYKNEIKDIVYKITDKYNGSISAEHGIGRERKDDLTNYKSSEYINLLKSIKNAIDPKNIMNPNRIL